MSAVILDFGPDPAKTLRKKLAETWRRVDEQAAQAARTNEQMRGYEQYGRNHPIKEPPEPAA